MSLMLTRKVQTFWGMEKCGGGAGWLTPFHNICSLKGFRSQAFLSLVSASTVWIQAAALRRNKNRQKRRAANEPQKKKN